ncbi:hypothetical protein [Kutzneria chonburiensis]|uniref:SH3 domain-containing protein n=1 Tax=Kutzneria chonburiensis TaxID=1483604 RepID=A0ABV6N0T1_9PSEU|nr:hypothetical protein [Kutzneria chonburiensis]
MHGKRVLAAAAAALGAVVVTAPIASASPAAGPAFACGQSYTHVRSSIDWLRIHTSPGVNTPAVGQIPGGSGFCFNSASGRTVGGIYWVDGYGYNGSTRVSGWADGEYLIWP